LFFSLGAEDGLKKKQNPIFFFFKKKRENQASSSILCKEIGMDWMDDARLIECVKRPTHPIPSLPI
jgi:hypothetical protein